jgi:hypothetical protein
VVRFLNTMAKLFPIHAASGYLGIALAYTALKTAAFFERKQLGAPAVVQCKGHR